MNEIKQVVDIQLLDGSNHPKPWIEALEYVANFREDFFDNSSKDNFWEQLSEHLANTVGIQILCNDLSTEVLETHGLDDVRLDNYVFIKSILVIAGLFIQGVSIDGA